MKIKHPPLAEVLLSDETELPEELRRKIHGEKDDETTQVTKLFEELEECAADTKDELNKTGELAVRVSRLSKKTKSYSTLRLVLSQPPPPPVEGEGT